MTQASLVGHSLDSRLPCVACMEIDGCRHPEADLPGVAELRELAAMAYPALPQPDPDDHKALYAWVRRERLQAWTFAEHLATAYAPLRAKWLALNERLAAERRAEVAAIDPDDDDDSDTPDLGDPVALLATENARG